MGARVPVGTNHHQPNVSQYQQSSSPYQKWYPNLFQSTQTMGKAFVEIGQGPLLSPPDPVSHQLQLVGILHNLTMNRTLVSWSSLTFMLRFWPSNKGWEYHTKMHLISCISWSWKSSKLLRPHTRHSKTSTCKLENIHWYAIWTYWCWCWCQCKCQYRWSRSCKGNC